MLGIDGKWTRIDETFSGAVSYDASFLQSCWGEIDRSYWGISC